MIELTVYGMPAPQGSKKFVGHAKTTGRAILVESSKKVKPWRSDVKDAAERYLLTARPATGAVIVSMVFTMPKPKSAPKTRVSYPSKRPDLSKLIRSTEDALTDAGLWDDDAAVLFYTNTGKVFPNEHPRALNRPGVRITIRAVEPQAQQQSLDMPPRSPFEDQLRASEVPF